MTEADGLRQWQDGKGQRGLTAEASLESKPSETYLWVVRLDDVVYAAEHCAFGSELHDGVVKHTNLTGGASAHCGGELQYVDEDLIMISGASGRYGPRSKKEMDDAARAFRDTGYTVYSVGFDGETNRPFRFGDRTPDIV